MSLTFNISPFFGGVSQAEADSFAKGLDKSANYLYSVCGRYTLPARNIAALNSGNVIYGNTPNYVTSHPTLYFTLPSNQSSVTFAELNGVPLANILMVSRSTQVKQPVLSTTTDMNQIQYVNGTFYPPVGDVFIAGEVIAVIYIS